MGKIVAYLIIIIMVSLTFLPVSRYYNSKLDKKEIEQNLNLSCRVLKTSFKIDYLDNKNLGMNSEISVNIDKNMLLESFFNILRNNYPNINRYNDIVKNIKLKVLVLNDRFYYSGSISNWSIPIFYTVYNESIGTDIYLNIDNSIVYYYVNNVKAYIDILDLGIDNKTKTQFIIDKVNQIIVKNTINRIMTKVELKNYGITINVRNPYLSDYNEIKKSQHYNILKGSTFIVIYSTGENIISGDNECFFKNIAAAGYTLNKKY